MEDPTLRVRLSQGANGNLLTDRHKDYVSYRIGNTKVHLDEGLLYAKVTWGIDGLDYPIPNDVAQFVELYEIKVDYGRIGQRRAGVYILRSGKKVLARARVATNPYSTEQKSDLLVTGAKREHAVQLYELIRDGKVQPDAEIAEFKQIEGGLRELNRLRRQVPELEAKVQVRDERLKTLAGQLASARQQLASVQATIAAK